jgi:hypothetical protein
MTMMKIRKHDILNPIQGFKPAARKGTLHTSSRAKAERKAE